MSRLKKRLVKNIKATKNQKYQDYKKNVKGYKTEVQSKATKMWMIRVLSRKTAFQNQLRIKKNLVSHFLLS